ncbi:hypothetical protein CALCODRAFT_556085 [Calocera cornea HHB12733]|uniref:Uncharacterized protein n=1 Tax=Calocera cornea HHB12733 TaxID=1353952 RepID=A0A165F397_9BASI|nr:hypothetical protein CALCODRAFT_556085 [Calocera cornea HHB12733]
MKSSNGLLHALSPPVTSHPRTGTMRVLSFLAAALCPALALASYLPDSAIRARAPAPSSSPCTPVTLANCPQLSLCGDTSSGGINIGIGTNANVVCTYYSGYICEYVTDNGLFVGVTPGHAACCPAYIGTCSALSKRAVPKARDMELALSQRAEDLKRDIEDVLQPW